MERALAIDENALGPDHPTVGIRLNNLGQLLQAVGDYEGARPFLRTRRYRFSKPNWVQTTPTKRLRVEEL